jgi:hypothetical protein
MLASGPPDLSRRRRGVPGRGPLSSAARLLLSAVAVILACPPAAAQRVPDEFRLKAAFLFRFPEFVQWPAGALHGRPSIDLCVLAPNPFGRVLEQLVEGESLSGRRLAVRYVHADGVNTCHLLYVPSGTNDRKALLQRIAASPILTVSDATRFLDDGGMVQLTVVENRVRFEISTGAAVRAGLKLSAQLLRLAVAVREEQP